ncbi:hypothetical protein Tco_0339787 [Tanacetum coccineum]
MELVLEQTQQGTSYEVSVSAEGVEELKRKVKIKGEKKEALLILRQKLEHQSDTQVIIMKMEILLEPTSNKLMVNPHGFEGYLKIELQSIKVKEFQRSFCHSDTQRLSRSDEVLKLKNLKKDALLRLFKLTYQERYEHVGSEVTSSQDGEVYKMMKGDYAWLMISRSSRSHSYIHQSLVILDAFVSICMLNGAFDKTHANLTEPLFMQLLQK